MGGKTRPRTAAEAAPGTCVWSWKGENRGSLTCVHLSCHVWLLLARLHKRSKYLKIHTCAFYLKCSAKCLINAVTKRENKKQDQVLAQDRRLIGGFHGEAIMVLHTNDTLTTSLAHICTRAQPTEKEGERNLRDSEGPKRYR